MTPVPVDDPGDPRIAPYAAMRERDLVGHGARFVAEGEVVLERLLRGSRFRAESVLILDRRLPRLEPLLGLLAPGTPVYVGSRAVIDRLVGFHLHRGVLAVGMRGAEPDAATLLASLPPAAMILVLIGLANHDNVGGIFRNAAAFGADAVLLDETCCDPLYRKAIRVSVGASLTVPFAKAGRPEDLLDLLARGGWAAFALSPAGEERIEAVAWPARTALLLGAEGPGLPAAILQRCRAVRIPIRPGFDSLNVATASGIALHAARSQHTGRIEGP